MRMKKKLLLILNANAGMQKANKYFVDILDLFIKSGYIITTSITQINYSATEIVQDYGKNFDLIVCIGGDGTFNQTVAGVIKSGCNVPIGYIPAGSTNDFANGLNLNKDIMSAAYDIIDGKEIKLDIGKFNDRYFSYVASSGIFTRVSYATPQEAKNIFGRLAYIFEGVRDLADLKSEHLKIETQDTVFEDDYIFSAFCNATSVGGVLKLNQNLVDLSDGLFELLLIKMPKNIIELSEIIYALRNQDYSTNLLTFNPISQAEVFCDSSISWTLDGEYMAGCKGIRMEVINNAITLIVPDRNKN